MDFNKGLHNSNLIQNGSNFIIDPINNNTKINYNLPADLMDGKINPLYAKTYVNNITIDSRFRDNYFNTSSSDYKVNLPNKLSKVVSLSLDNIELPLTYYSISRKYGNDYFWIEINQSDETLHDKDCITLKGWYFIRIPQGNYTQADIIDALNHQLKIAGSDHISSGLFNYFKFKVNITQGGSGDARTIFYNVSNECDGECDYTANLYFNIKEIVDSTTTTTLLDKPSDFDTTSLPLKFGWNLGYREGAYKSNLKKISSFISEGIYDGLGARYSFLVVDDYNNNNVNNSYYSNFSDSVLNKNILARISLKGSTFSVLSDSNYSITSIPRKYFGPIDIQKLKIQLLDEYGRTLDLNNMDFSFSIKIECLYN